MENRRFFYCFRERLRLLPEALAILGGIDECISQISQRDLSPIQSLQVVQVCSIWIAREL
jgi:hypothetical protein